MTEPLNPHLVHWPVRFGREELMIETRPEIPRNLAEYLVSELLSQCGIGSEEPANAALEVRLGLPSIRMATLNLSVEGAMYVVTLTQNRVSVLPYIEM